MRPADVLDERREREHELLARALVSIFLVPAPELFELDGLDVGFQSLSYPAYARGWAFA